MANNSITVKDNANSPVTFFPESTDLGSSVFRPGFGAADGALQTIGAKADATWDGSSAASGISVWRYIGTKLEAVRVLLVGPLATQVFAPIRGTTVALTVNATATVAPVALPVCTATSYRVRNPTTSNSAVTWTLAANTTTPPVIPTAYTAAGTGGVVGDNTLDPGGVEVIGLTAAQQVAIAAGTLYLSAICPASGSATLIITPGTGA